MTGRKLNKRRFRKEMPIATFNPLSHTFLSFCILPLPFLLFILTHRPLSQHPTISDDLPNNIISGKIQVKPNVTEFTETDAIFEDGTVEENIDVVVFATGYSFSFPFLDSLVKVNNNEVSLYKLMFPPDLEKPTLAIIGLIQPLGIVLPIAELQARWAVRVFKGMHKDLSSPLGNPPLVLSANCMPPARRNLDRL